MRLGSRSALLCSLAAVAAVAAVANPAYAQEGCETPGDESALDQYCESVPYASGEKGNNAGAGGRIDRRITETRRSAAAKGRDGPVPGGEQESRSPGDVPGAVGSAIESSPDGGVEIIWMLAGLAAGMLVLALIWRRRRPGDS